MVEPEFPINEPMRLAMVQSLNLLDTPIEDQFERATRMMNRILNVPICGISLIDAHRQWFKSINGLSVHEIPRRLSFCAHAILADTAMIVTDTARDPRFCDHPLVIEPPYVRFYAGYPLVISPGIPVGTLCLFDTVPRHLTKDDMGFIEDIASVVINQMKTHLLRNLYLYDQAINQK